MGKQSASAENAKWTVKGNGADVRKAAKMNGHKDGKGKTDNKGGRG